MKRGLGFEALLLCALAASGCDLDMVEVPSLGAGAPVALQVGLRQSEDSLTLTAYLHPGTSESGVPRALGDDGLRLDGRVVEPYEIDPAGIRFYRVSELSATSAIIRLRLPPISGVDGWPAEIELWPLRATVSRAAGVSTDDHLELSITGLDDPREPTFGFWRVAFYAGACGGPPLVSLSASHPPPSVMRLPLDILPGSVPPTSVRYETRIDYDVTDADESYRISISRSFDACLQLPAGAPPAS